MALRLHCPSDFRCSQLKDAAQGVTFPHCVQYVPAARVGSLIDATRQNHCERVIITLITRS